MYVCMYILIFPHAIELWNNLLTLLSYYVCKISTRRLHTQVNNNYLITNKLI